MTNIRNLQPTTKPAAFSLPGPRIRPFAQFCPCVHAFALASPASAALGFCSTSACRTTRACGSFALCSASPHIDSRLRQLRALLCFTEQLAPAAASLRSGTPLRGYPSHIASLVGPSRSRSRGRLRRLEACRHPALKPFLYPPPAPLIEYGETICACALVSC